MWQSANLDEDASAASLALRILPLDRDVVICNERVTVTAQTHAIARIERIAAPGARRLFVDVRDLEFVLRIAWPKYQRSAASLATSAGALVDF